jgi:hypothetical protein
MKHYMLLNFHPFSKSVHSLKKRPTKVRNAMLLVYLVLFYSTVSVYVQTVLQLILIDNGQHIQGVFSWIHAYEFRPKAPFLSYQFMMQGKVTYK